jgi:hypothetical protein
MQVSAAQITHPITARFEKRRKSNKINAAGNLNSQHGSSRLDLPFLQ